MKTDDLKQVMDWLKTTDIVEVGYNHGEDGFSLATAEAPSPSYPPPASRFAAVSSPAVGILRWNEPGKPRPAEEADPVEEGQLLAVVETAKGKFSPVKAPSTGRLARVLAEDGAAVEFGQALFFIESR